MKIRPYEVFILISGTYKKPESINAQALFLFAHSCLDVLFKVVDGFFDTKA
jgi:methionine salvage enolase-phosphatase E1